MKLNPRAEIYRQKQITKLASNAVGWAIDIIEKDLQRKMVGDEAIQ